MMISTIILIIRHGKYINISTNNFLHQKTPKNAQNYRKTPKISIKRLKLAPAQMIMLTSPYSPRIFPCLLMIIMIIKIIIRSMCPLLWSYVPPPKTAEAGSTSSGSLCNQWHSGGNVNRHAQHSSG